MKMPFFIVSNIAIVVPMSHLLPWNGPLDGPTRNNLVLSGLQNDIAMSRLRIWKSDVLETSSVVLSC